MDGKWKGEIRGREGDIYFSAVVVCRGSGMSTAHACTCIGHQETRGEVRDMLTCAYGLYRLLVVLVRSEFDPVEWEILVKQDLVWIGCAFANAVRCFIRDGSEPAPPIIDKPCVCGNTTVRDASGFEPEVRAVIDTELFVGLHSADRRISDGVGSSIDGVCDVRRVRVIEEGSCACGNTVNRTTRSFRGTHEDESGKSESAPRPRASAILPSLHLKV